MGRDLKNFKRWRKETYAKRAPALNKWRRDKYATRTNKEKKLRKIKLREQYKNNKTRKYHAARTLRYRRKLKTQVINGYGGKCTCCGERRYEFLTVDHVNNNGKAHRILLTGKKEGGTGPLYRVIRDAGFPLDYTILCFNCNIARSLYGVCPHQQEQNDA